MSKYKVKNVKIYQEYSFIIHCLRYRFLPLHLGSPLQKLKIAQSHYISNHSVLVLLSLNTLLLCPFHHTLAVPVVETPTYLSFTLFFPDTPQVYFKTVNLSVINIFSYTVVPRIFMELGSCKLPVIASYHFIFQNEWGNPIVKE